MTSIKYFSNIMECVICSKQQFTTVYTGKISQDVKKEHTIVQCDNCSHVQLSPNVYDFQKFYEADNQTKNSLEVSGNSYNEYFQYLLNYRYSTASFVYQQIQNFTDPIKMLDVGAGDGPFLAQLINLGCTHEIKAIDFSTSRLEKINEEPNISIEKSDLSDKWFSEHSETYDIITCIHVLEHLINPIEVLINMYKKLNNNGILCIEVPNFNDSLKELEEFLPYYYSKAHISYFTTKILVDNIKKHLNADVEVHNYQNFSLQNHSNWYAFKKPVKPCTFSWQYNHKIQTTWLNELIFSDSTDCIRLVIKKSNV